MEIDPRDNGAFIIGADNSPGLERQLPQICLKVRQTVEAYWAPLIIALLTSGLFVSQVKAAPINLSARLKGTNQVELTFGPVVLDGNYQILAREKGPKKHWMTFGNSVAESNNPTCTATFPLGGEGDLKSMTAETLGNWEFVAGIGDDSDNDGIPDIYEDLATRTDPFTPDDHYGDPDGDNWSNVQELFNKTDPLRADYPPMPRISVAYNGGTNSLSRMGKAVVTIDYYAKILPDYFIIERAPRTLKPPGENTNHVNSAPGQRTMGANTNRVANPRLFTGRRPDGKRDDWMVTGEFAPVARVMTQPGVQLYTYVETNVDLLCQPPYRVQCHFTPPSRANLTPLNATTLRQTMLTINVRNTPKGCNLIAMQPIPYGRYLLMVRDRNNPRWRASGYFTGSTNRNPVFLQTDAKGMMNSPQTPIAMPEVKFLPDVVQPEFTAGWGEDSDGDGLPDIYEILVTGTDPLQSDTGNTGVLDGYREPMQDGWSNLEKFRRRADPLKPAYPPPPIVLIKPTGIEAVQASTSKCDLRYEPFIEIRNAGAADFQTIQQPLWSYYRAANSRDPYHARANFDLRVSWRIPEWHPRISSHGP